MMLRTVYQVTDKELYNYTNDSTDDIYDIQLYFLDKRNYDECLKSLANLFQVKGEGQTMHYQKVVHKVSVSGLKRGEGNYDLSFHSYTYNEKYIKVYWNNNQKKLIFYQ